MNVIIRADASVEIGTGHVMRCLTLADALREKGVQVSFICRELPGNLCSFIENKGYQVYRLPYKKESERRYTNKEPLHTRHAHWLGVSLKNDAEQTKIILKKQPQKIDWLIVDHYALEKDWEIQMRPFVNKIMVIDDLADRPHDCDLLLDQNLYDDMENRYNGLVPNKCQLFLGPRYALLRPEFKEARKYLRERDGKVRRILIFFGGSDLTNETTKALDAIRMLQRPDISVDVVVGNSNPHKQQVRKLCNVSSNISFFCQVDNIAQLMNKADLAIGAGGTATWERCCLGIPSIIISVAYNQEGVAKAIDQEKMGIYLGRSKEVSSWKIVKKIQMLLNSPEITSNISKIAKYKVDGFGVVRMINAIFNTSDQD